MHIVFGRSASACPASVAKSVQILPALAVPHRRSSWCVEFKDVQLLERRSSSERFAEAVGGFSGSLLFVVLHLVLLVAWLLINRGKIPSARPFDPLPFSLLGVIVAVEAVILSSFILMRQNRMMRRRERRDHLNLQFDLLAEKEITKLLRMVRAMCGQRDFRTSWRIRRSVISARIPLLSRSVRCWRIGCRGPKVKHPQLQQDLDSADRGADKKSLASHPRSLHWARLRRREDTGKASL